MARKGMISIRRKPSRRLIRGPFAFDEVTRLRGVTGLQYRCNRRDRWASLCSANDISLDFEGVEFCGREWLGRNRKDRLYTFSFPYFSGDICWKSTRPLTAPELKQMLLAFRDFGYAWHPCDLDEIDFANRSFMDESYRSSYMDEKGFSYWTTNRYIFAKAHDRFFTSDFRWTPWALLAHWLHRKLYPVIEHISQASRF